VKLVKLVDFKKMVPTLGQGSVKLILGEICRKERKRCQKMDRDAKIVAKGSGRGRRKIEKSVDFLQNLIEKSLKMVRF
jgi:hypothetical protein